jgi:hypothetical protein
LSCHVRKDISGKIGDLKATKESFENILKNQHFYTMDFSELMERHRDLGKNQPKKNFMEKRKNPTSFLEDKTISYIKILKKYNIEHEDVEKMMNGNSSGGVGKQVSQQPLIKKCDNILCDSKEFVVNPEQNVEICRKCGSQKEGSYKSLNYKDLSRVNMSNKYFYERRVHFKDCINQFQGKQNSVVDDKVYADIERQLDLHGLLNSVTSEMSSQEAKLKRFERVTKEHIALFLKETGHSKHYEDTVLIYHKLTGKDVPDISHLEVKLMEDFDLVSEAYDKLFKFTGLVERKSVINTNYCFFQLLRRFCHLITHAEQLN